MIKMKIFVFTGLLVFLSVVQSRETTGIPGVDYPNYLTIPMTSFKCSEQEYIPGFYADMETNCQVYHFCTKDNQETFLCPVGSTFNQAILACDSWYRSNCSLAPHLYNANSGTLLEGATRIVPMLMKLRNRSQNKTPVRASSGVVYEKISSLYGNNADAAQFETRNSDFAANGHLKSSSENSNSLKSDSKTSEEVSENSPMQEDILTKLEESVPNNEPEDDVYYRDPLDKESDIPGNLVYDPVTEQYYVDDSFQNDWQENLYSDKFGLNYENLVNKYGLVMDDSEVSDFSENVPLDFKEDGEMDNMEELNDNLSERLLNLEQPSRRVRRKPIYTVVKEDDDPYSGVVFPSSVRGMQNPVLGSEESLSTEFSPAVTEVGSEVPSEVSTGGSEDQDKADTDPPFEMTDELRYPFTPLNHTEVPMTSEEFEHAILTELVAPKIEEHDLTLLASEWDQMHSQVSSDRAARGLQSDEQYTYVDGMPDGYAYSQVYNSNGLTSDGEEGNEEVLAEDPVESDTYVVIPDESDVLDSEDEMPSVSYDSTYGMQSEQQNEGESGNVHDLHNTYSDYMPNYESPEAYETVSTPQFSDAFVEQQQYSYINPETQEWVSPYDYAHSYVADEATAFSPVYREVVDRCALSAPEFYCKQTMGSADYMYGTQSGYYDRFYSNPHLRSGNFGYETGSEWPSELSSHVDDSGAAESSMPFWISTDPSVEIGSERFNTDASRSESDFAYSSEDAVGASEDLTEISQLDNNMRESLGDGNSENQDETFYVLDFAADENSESIDVTEISDVTESDQIDLQQSFQPGEPEQSVETSEGNYLNVDSKFSNPTDATEALLPEGNLNLENVNSAETSGSSVKFNSRQSAGWPFQSSESQNKFVELPEMEHVGHQTAGESMMSDGGNKYFPSNRFLNNMEFAETMDFGPYAVPASLGQQSIAKGSFTPPIKKSNEFLHRSGNSGQPDMSKLSVLQERIKSLKQGKFGAFKKYVSSTGNKN